MAYPLIALSNRLWQDCFEIWVGLSRENGIQKCNGKNNSPWAPLHFPIHQDVLTPLFWGEKNEIGNEIRRMGVLVPLKFASSFKSPDPRVFVT